MARHYRQGFTIANVRICAQAVADYLKQTDLVSKGLVIGYDTRFASEDFAAATAEVVAGQVFRNGTTTPYLRRKQHASQSEKAAQSG